jgi:L-amino acid N-acyltransferase
MTPLVRAAVRDDINAITEIYNHAVVHTTATYDLEPVTVASRRAWFDHKSASGWPVLVACDVSASVVGWATYGPFREKAGWAPTLEHSLYVRDGQQGSGVGSVLMNALLDRAREGGHHVMLGMVDSDNAGSLAFHERRGFRRVGQLPEVGHKFGRRLDVTLLQLILDYGASVGRSRADQIPAEPVEAPPRSLAASILRQAQDRRCSANVPAR